MLQSGQIRASDEDSASLVGTKMRSARQAARLNLTELAQLVGYSKGHLSAVETGNAPASPKLVSLYERVLGLKAGTLYRLTKSDRHETADEPVNSGSSFSVDKMQKSASSPEMDKRQSSPHNLPVSAWDVYVSGELDDLSPREYVRLTSQVYEPIVRTCESMDLRCYCPHLDENNWRNIRPLGSDWSSELNIIKNAGVVVAYVGIPSLSTGAHLEMARAEQVPIILLCEASKSANISRLALKNPALRCVIAFENSSQLEDALCENLYWLFSARNLETVAHEEQWHADDYHKSLRSLEKTRNSGWKPGQRKPLSREDWQKHPLLGINFHGL